MAAYITYDQARLEDSVNREGVWVGYRIYGCCGYHCPAKISAKLVSMDISRNVACAKLKHFTVV